MRGSIDCDGVESGADLTTSNLGSIFLRAGSIVSFCAVVGSSLVVNLRFSKVSVASTVWDSRCCFAA